MTSKKDEFLADILVIKKSNSRFANIDNDDFCAIIGSAYDEHADDINVVITGDELEFFDLFLPLSEYADKNVTWGLILKGVKCYAEQVRENKHLRHERERLEAERDELKEQLRRAQEKDRRNTAELKRLDEMRERQVRSWSYYRLLLIIHVLARDDEEAKHSARQALLEKINLLKSDVIGYLTFKV